MPRDHIFIDLDGVVCDFVTGLFDKLGVMCPYMDAKNHGSFDATGLVGIDWDDIVHSLDYDFWVNLPLTHDAYAIMAITKDLAAMTGASRSFLTHPVSTRGCMDAKRDWVDRHFRGMSVTLVPDGDKSHWGRDGFWLFDDKDSNVKDFRRGGGHGILLPRPWNSRHLETVSDEQTLGYVREQVRSHIASRADRRKRVKV
jgi:hypothetical protein